MTRRVVGYFLAHHGEANEISLAPYVNVDVGDRESMWNLEFLIDTGADRTLLSPKHAFVVFGRQYLQLDFASSNSRRDFTGVAPQPARTMLHFASLTFAAEDKSEITHSLPIAVAEPIPPYPGAHGNWLMPSLLGRDVLQHFDLRLGYHPPAVVLEEASANG